jgi:hypothetical protein
MIPTVDQLHAALDAASIPTSGVSSNTTGGDQFAQFVKLNDGATTYRIDYTETATSAQIAAGNTLASTYDPSVMLQQQSLLAQLVAWRKAWTVTVNGYTLKASDSDQQAFTSLTLSDQLAVSQGAAQLTDNTFLQDATGAMQTLTIQQLLTTMVAYASACKGLVQQYVTLESQIGSATTLAQLTAITIP